MLEMLPEPISQEARIVRYAEFRDELEGALREEGLLTLLQDA